MPHLFDPLTLRGVTLRNRIGVSPMCQYSSDADGRVTDWHLAHIGSRAVGGAGLIIMECTAVSPQARISSADNGLWSEEHIPGLRRIAEFVGSQGAVPGIQLGHAGRKASAFLPWQGGHKGAEGMAMPPDKGGWQSVAPSPISYGGHRFAGVVPREMTLDDIAAVQEDFRQAARRAREAGFRWLELHAGNGYLCATFQSPLTNHRTDGYGGSLENRMRFTVEVVRAMRREWPDDLPLSVRYAITEWAEGGWDVQDSIALARALKAEGADVINCISGGNVREGRGPWHPGVNVPLAEAVRRGADMAVAANGGITEPTHAEEILANGRADVVLLAREMLKNPYWPRLAARVLGQEDRLPWPDAYGHWL